MPAEELTEGCQNGASKSQARAGSSLLRAHSTPPKRPLLKQHQAKRPIQVRLQVECARRIIGRDHLHHTRMSLFHLHPVESMRTAAREQHPQAKAAASRACPFVDICAGDTDMQRIQTARLVPLLSQISGEGFGKAAVKAGTPGKAAAAGSTAWAPSPSRFRRTTQENTQPAPTSRKVTAFRQVGSMCGDQPNSLLIMSSQYVSA